MATLSPGLDEKRAPLFNSRLETGIRALLLLEAMFPRACDLTEMTWFDHLVVHTSDLDGLGGETAPSSLHPDLPGRTGELFVRRRLIEESLSLMHRVHLVDILPNEQGFQFVASEDAPSFVAMLQAPYTHELRRRAEWLADRVRELPTADIAKIVEANVGRWQAAFGTDTAPGRGQT